MKVIKTICLKHDFEKTAAKLEGQFPDCSHVDQHIDKTRRLVMLDGNIVAMFLRNVIPPAFHELAFASCWKYAKDRPSNRSTAVGTRSLQRVRTDGSLAERRGVPKRVLKLLKQWGTASGVLGFVGGTRDISRLTERHPEMLNRNRRLVELVDDIYRDKLPMPYARQWSVIEGVPTRQLWDTVFSSIYLARNFQTAYHRDGNLKGVMTALMATGNFRGGELVLPRWKIAIALRPGDLLLFDAEQLHGNLEMQGDRLSLAFHCVSIRRLLE
jgi:hypothetical protein